MWGMSRILFAAWVSKSYKTMLNEGKINDWLF